MIQHYIAHNILKVILPVNIVLNVKFFFTVKIQFLFPSDCPSAPLWPWRQTFKLYLTGPGLFVELAKLMKAHMNLGFVPI